MGAEGDLCKPHGEGPPAWGVTEAAQDPPPPTAFSPLRTPPKVAEQQAVCANLLVSVHRRGRHSDTAPTPLGPQARGFGLDSGSRVQLS